MKGKGTIFVKVAESCEGWTFSLSNALWVPQIDVNLISIRQLAKKSVTTVCGKDEAVGTHDDDDVVFTSKVESDVDCLETVPNERHVANVSMNNDHSGFDNSD